MPLETPGYLPPISPDHHPLRSEEGATKIVLPKTFVGHQVSLVRGEEDTTSTIGLKLSQREQIPEPEETTFGASIIKQWDSLLQTIIQVALWILLKLKIIEPSYEALPPESTPHESDIGKKDIQDFIHLKNIQNTHVDTLTHEGRSIQVVNLFRRELWAAEYYLDGELMMQLSERAKAEPQFHTCDKLIQMFGEQGFKNISRILHQSSIPSCYEDLIPKYIELGCVPSTSGARYNIQKEKEGYVKLNIDFEISFKEWADKPEEEKRKPDFIGCHREIVIPIEELTTKWDDIPTGETMPQTIVYDLRTTPQETAEAAKENLTALLLEHK